MRLLVFCVFAVLAVPISLVQCDDNWWYWFFDMDPDDYSEISMSPIDFSYSGHDSDEPYDESLSEKSASLSNGIDFVPIEDASPGRDGRDGQDGREDSGNGRDFVAIDRTGVMPVDSYNVRQESDEENSVQDESQQSGEGDNVEPIDVTLVLRAEIGSASADSLGSASDNSSKSVSSQSPESASADASDSSSQKITVEASDSSSQKVTVEASESSEKRQGSSSSSSQAKAVDASQSPSKAESSSTSSQSTSSKPVAPLEVAPETDVTEGSTDVTEGSTVSEVSNNVPQPAPDTLDPANPSESTSVEDSSDSSDDFDDIFTSDDFSAEWERAFWKRFMTALMVSEDLFDEIVPVPQSENTRSEIFTSDEPDEISDETTSSTLVFYDPDTQSVRFVPIDDISDLDSLFDESSSSRKNDVEVSDESEVRDKGELSQTIPPSLNDQIEAPQDFEATTRPMDWSRSSDVVEEVELEAPDDIEETAGPVDWSQSSSAAGRTNEPDGSSGAVPEATGHAKPASPKNAEPDRMNMQTFAKKIMKAFKNAFADT